MSCHFKLESLPDPGNRFTLGKEIGSGVSSNVFEAKDNEQGGMKVAVKIVKIVAEYEDDVKEEYRILKEFSAHPNLPNFYGAYYKGEQVWFVMELCEGGSVINLVRGLMNKAKHLTEEHIAFILKEITSALSYLHEKNIIHRDVRGSNVLLTKDGEIKLVDFGISRVVKGGESKLNTCVGSPCWMAPELIKSDVEGAENNYDNKIDVWALGITGIELADEEPPFQGMHPSRAIFQILRNPPPTFSVPSKWSQNYIDFVTECLEKNPEERPFVTEFLSHPFLTSLPEQDAHLGKELFILQQGITEKVVQPKEIHLRRGKLQTKHIEPEEDIIVEDLAGLDSASEELAMYHLEQRFRKGLCYTYVGDILLFVNPYKDQNIYGTKYHCKYQFKSRSDNSPHVYSIADSAYQDMLHHNQPQRIVLTGENLSGKTTNFKHILDHLLFLGHITSISEKIKATTNVIHAFGNAPTTVNTNSTRHVLNTQITYTKTGKLSGAIFWLYQLEKWRIGSNKLLGNENFHIFYYFHDALEEQNNLKSYNLEQGTNYKYLPRRNEDVLSKIGGAFGTRRVNAERYKEIMNYLSNVMEFPSTEIETIEKILAAVILLGEIGFTNDDDGHAEIENADIASKVAELLEADAEKFSWSLCNYCMVEKGTAQGRKYNATEASEARHVLARGMYSRLVDWIINIINMKLSITRAILGDVHYISVMDIPGFEVLEGNKIEQLFVNTLNEQLQYFYTQKDFACELKELEEEGIVLPPFQYYDNKSTIDELLSKPDGLFYIIDEATRTNSNYKFIIDSVANSGLNTRIKKRTSSSFTVAHYSGIIEYNTRDFPTINKDFISAEMTECLRGSNNSVVKQLFTNQLTKSGNLTIISEQNLLTLSGKGRRWGAALVSGGQKCKKFNTECYGEYSQTRNTRTASAVYRASSIEIMKVLSGALEDGSTRFVRCIRPNADESGLFKEKTVRLQLRSLAIIDTAKARQNGYSYRISFAEFIERYKFLAFDFNENVELTRDNCRLLLVRLKMEGWILGKTKVFLRYYDEEYLSRLYEIHVKKIVKIQAMMRTFITKRKILPRVQSQQSLGKN